MKQSGYKIQVVNDKTPQLSPEIQSVVTFNRTHFYMVKTKPLIFIDHMNSYRRYYSNFKKLSHDESTLIYEFLLNPTNFREYFYLPSTMALNYYYAKLQIWFKKDKLTFTEILREINVLLKSNYKYYSVACGILTAMFFSKIGIPIVTSKINEKIYGIDIFDDIFFPLAFPFMVFETVTDLLTGTKIEDPLAISRAFISFLLWKGAKSLLSMVAYKIFRNHLQEIPWITW